MIRFVVAQSPPWPKTWKAQTSSGPGVGCAHTTQRLIADQPCRLTDLSICLSSFERIDLGMACRRFLLTSLAVALAAPLAVEAQHTAGRVWKIGFLGGSPVLTHPESLHGAKTLRARIVRPRLPESERDMTWPALVKVDVRPLGQPPTSGR